MLSFIDCKQLQDYYMLSLCLWREARGVPDDEKYMVGCVIRNRVNKTTFLTYTTVITAPKQFSSFNQNDPNSVKWPLYSDPSWICCLAIADRVMTVPNNDPTNGATHYFDKTMFNNPPYWAKPPLEEMLRTTNFSFWR